jgi:hypothetical protein
MALETNSTLVGSGSNSNIEMQVDPTFQSGRMNLRPLEYTNNGLIGGHFAIDAITGAMAGAIVANSQILSIRWADSRFIFVLKRFSVAAVCTAFTANALPDLDLIRAISFTANASGGTAIVPSTAAQKVRSASMSGSLFANEGEIRVASTAALTAGTQTLDTAGMACCPMGNFSAANTVWPGSAGVVDLYRHISLGQHPLILGNNEGLIVRTPTGWATSTLTLKLYFTMEWAEVPAY